MGNQYVSVTGKSPLIALGLSHNIPTFISYLGCLALCSLCKIGCLFAEPSIETV